MKILSIGRGENCNIYLDDQNISRRHAQLRIYPTGRMEIVDFSQNGTFINNVRVQPNAPTPVTRQDVVSFAHTRLLDWSLVPDPVRPYRIGGIVLAVICAIAVAWWGITAVVDAMRNTLDADAAALAAAVDSATNAVNRVDVTPQVEEPVVEGTTRSPTSTDTVVTPEPDSTPAQPVATPTTRETKVQTPATKAKKTAKKPKTTGTAQEKTATVDKDKDKNRSDSEEATGTEPQGGTATETPAVNTSVSKPESTPDTTKRN